MAWIELHQALPQHRKLLALRDALRLRTPAALGHMCLLWLWALSLGIHVRRLTLTNVVLTCFVCSVIVSHVGLINFIGLVAPHIVRMVVGNNYIYLIPGSVLAGAALLLLSDLAARVVIMPVILPIGALTAFLGGPLFLYLLFKGRGRT